MANNDRVTSARSIRNTLKETESESFENQGLIELNTRKTHLLDAWNVFAHNQEFSEVTEENRAQFEEQERVYDTVENSYLAALMNLNRRIAEIEVQREQYEFGAPENNGPGDDSIEIQQVRESENAERREIEQVPPIQQVQPNAPANQQVIRVGAQEIVVKMQNGKMMENTWGYFDGNLTKWQGFHDRYCAVVHKDESISNAMKFIHLQSSLKGRAAQALSSWQDSEENYMEAWDRLKQLFQRKYQTSKELLWKIRDLPKMDKASSGMLQKFSNVAHEVLRQLKGLKYPVEHFDLIFVHALHDKLDPETSKAWELKRSSETPAINELLEFLDKQAKASQGIQYHEHKNQKDNRKRHGDDKHFDSKRARHESSKEKDDSNDKKDYKTCRVCKEIHPVIRCPKFKEMNMNERKKIVREKELCFNCLKPYHNSKECFSNECHRCNVKHNMLLCPKSPANEKSVNSVQLKSKKPIDTKPNSKRE